VPTVFDNYEAQILVEGQEVKFSLWDTAGTSPYTKSIFLCSLLKMASRSTRSLLRSFAPTLLLSFSIYGGLTGGNAWGV
jgi:GTPase SAR1 family protein